MGRSVVGNGRVHPRKGVRFGGEAGRRLAGERVQENAVYEVAEFLRRAMSEAKTSVSISTRGLAPHLVNRDFLRALEHLLRRGVQVTILLHEEANQWRSRGKDWIQAFDALAKLSVKFPAALVVREHRERRYYHISWDDQVALVANRPMLSNHGRIRSFERFAGYVINEPESVVAYLSRVAR